MVVLEEGGMLTTGHNQYLQPDYLSPLPTTLDAKKSPLALLAQTCSQIGADSSTKPLISPLDKLSKGNSSTSARSPPEAKFERTRSSPSEPKALGFKPYETNVLTKKSADDGRPASKASVHSVGGGDSASVSENNNNNDRKSGFSPGNGTPVGRKSASPSHPTANSDRRTPAEICDKTQSPQGNNNNNKTGNNNHSNQSSSNSCASPIIRSGMEILSGHPKDNPMGTYKHSAGFTSFASNPLCCPPGLSENPAFRPSFAGASPFSHHHAAAAALLGYPTATPSTGNPYLSYARVKTPNGAEALVPVCKDPYCSGCQYSMHNAQMVMGAGSCPSSCTQCDHQKYGLAMALSSLNPMPLPSLSYPSALSGGRPFVCNWVSGESYCGKRCGTSEELLQHLRSHTSFGTPGNGNVADAATTSTIVNTQHHPLLSPSAALHRVAANGAYPAPSLSPLGARYHPYNKPPTGPLPASLAASPYSAFNALSPYYSPYAIYGQRIGAAVHP